MTTRAIRTTIALPETLLAAMDTLIARGDVRSRNEFIADALKHELAAIERAAIDAGFAGMAEDTAYQAEARRIADEFRLGDWEAFQRGEARLTGDGE